MQSVTGVSIADKTPGSHGESPLSGDGASTGRLGDRLFGGAAVGCRGLVVALVT
jgi:phosphate transport system permease protein